MRGETGHWPRRRTRVIDWLVEESVRERFIDNLFGAVCRGLREEGLPLERATLHLRTLHPQLLGATLRWYPGLHDAEIEFHEKIILREDRHLKSPVRLVDDAAAMVRRRLDRPLPPQEESFAVFRQLRAEGFTDYVALPMTFTDGKRHVATFATRRKTGFDPGELAEIREMLPLLAMAIEIRLNRRITRNLLNAYVGPHAGERILRGEIDRGSAEIVDAAVWLADLRGSTRLAASLPHDELIALLNDYFDRFGEGLEAEGGEILKFLGDGLLAVFPLNQPDACGRALAAARRARAAVNAFNQDRAARGRPWLDFVLALHLGMVAWGNIGTRERLDFTVIGSAVHIARRLEELAKELGERVVISEAVLQGCPQAKPELKALGRHHLRGLETPIAVFALR